MADKDQSKSFWTTLPGLITAVAGLITAIGGLIAILNTAGIISKSSTSPPKASTSTPAPTRAQSADGPSAAGTSGECLSGYFQGISEDRVFSLEEGTLDFVLLSSHETKSGMIGLVLTDQGKKVVALRFSFFLNGEIFKIDSVVDTACQPVKYFVEGRPADKLKLQNWDSLRISLNGQDYLLRLGYGDGVLEVDKFTTFTP